MKAALPIDEHLEQIALALKEHRGAVVVAEPGAGKTTRVPNFLQQTFGGAVLCTQPRRIAARLASKRVAEENDEKLGQRVGYEVRLDKRVSANTQLRFMTEGLALRQWKKNHNQILILDEFHERHLDADMLLALAAEKQRTTKDHFSIVVMSATLDPKPIASFLGQVPIIQSTGREFPVEISYQAPRPQEKLEVSVSRALKTLLTQGLQGHVLVFLPGLAEIKRCEQKISDLAKRNELSIEKLHGSLPNTKQDQVLLIEDKRKIILATNIAETSLTIPGVKAVIDSGLARVNRHSPWTGLSSLEVSRISQASAKQRAGRAGRTSFGHCIRLYSEHSFRGSTKFDTPEIERSDLSACALRLADFNTTLETLHWLTPPPPTACATANNLLTSLGAIEAAKLSPLGKEMNRLPLHPRLSRLVIKSGELGIAKEGVLAACLLSEKTLRYSQRKGEDATFSSESDLQDDLEIMEDFERRGFRPEVARSHQADLLTAKTVAKSAKQISGMLSAPQGKASHSPDTALQLALLAAFADRACRREKKHSKTLLLCQGGAIVQSQSSAVIQADFVLAIDLMSRQKHSNSQRGKAFVRVVSKIDPLWLLEYPMVREVDIHEYSPETESVVRRKGIFYGDFPIDEERIIDPNKLDKAQTAKVLEEALLSGAWQKAVDAKSLSPFKKRIDFAQKQTPELPWPTIDDAFICKALLSMSDHVTRLQDLRKICVVDAIYWSLSEVLRTCLDVSAPTHVALPTRKRVPVEYETDRSPWIQSRLQDFFGLQEGPSVARGKVRLTLHLLAPNRRAVQVTTDLSGFWIRHYPTLRKQLMRRYPRHKWPEKP